MVPVDGVVVEGSGSIDKAPLTGEPIPIPVNPDDFVEEIDENAFTAEQLFLNSKIRDLFNRAEFERRDYRYESQPNVFFGAEKVYHVGFGKPIPGVNLDLDRPIRLNTIVLDALVLLGFCIIGCMLLYFSVQRRMRSL